MIDICLLGCGGMMPLHNRWLTSMLFRCGGKMILIDCGEGTQIPMARIGWGFKSIDVICFTHYHADHIIGLPGLLLTMGNSGREEPLTIIGPPSLYDVIKGIMVVAPQLPFELKLVELSDEQSEMINSGDIIVHSMPVNHGMPCLTYSLEIKRSGAFDVQKARCHNIPMKYWNLLQKGDIIEEGHYRYTPDMVLGEPRKGLKVSYCTDTRFTNSLISFVEASDLLICEGLYGEDEKKQKVHEKNHMIFSEAAYLAKSAHVKELWLTHYSPALKNPEDYIDSAKMIFENTVIGKDLMTKTLSFTD